MALPVYAFKIGATFYNTYKYHYVCLDRWAPRCKIQKWRRKISQTNFFMIKTITTLAEYCNEVNIPVPRHSCFDIRRFEDKVKTENSKQAPIRHEFYAIALRHVGENKTVNGIPLNSNVFFNSPYQIVSWEVLPKWKGWYIMFDQEFLSQSPLWKNLIIDFPFFRLDVSTPFDLPPDAIEIAEDIFQKIYLEYHADHDDKFQFIHSYTMLLLLLTRRHFRNNFIEEQLTLNRTNDILLVSRFQVLIESSFANKNKSSEVRQPSFYAQKLNVHTNHLNAMVKRITGKTAGTLIANGLISYSKSLLQQTDLSIKEIAFELHFKEATHFTFYFKKATGLTPQQYRQSRFDF